MYGFTPKKALYAAFDSPFLCNEQLTEEACGLGIYKDLSKNINICQELD